MQSKKDFLKSPIFLLFVLTLFLGANNYIWLQLNQHSPVDDEAFHLLSSLQYLDIISSPISLNTFSRLVRVDNLYPPFFPFSAALVALFFGKSAIVMTLTNILFLLGIFICLYLIGIKMQDRRVGLLASCLLSLYSMFFQLSRMFMLEIALCFMVVASITVLIYSQGFKKTNMSILFGVFLGLGLLTKQSYIFFITGPLIFLLLDSLFNNDLTIRKKIIKNLFLSFIVGAGIASWWYVPNFRRMLSLAVAAAADPLLVPHDIPAFSLRSSFFYLEVLFNDQILLFFFLVFISAIFILFKRKKDKFFFLFLVWIIFPYFVRTLIANKFWYYTLAYLPAVSFISAYGVLNIKKNFLRKTAILLILVVGFFQFFFISYNKYGHTSLHFAFHTGTKKDEDRMMDITLLPMKDILGGVKYYPRRGDWKRDAIITRILKESPEATPVIGVYQVDPNKEAREDPPQKTTIISKLDCYTGANFDGLSYYLALKDIPHKIFPLNIDLKERINFIISPIELENIKIGKINIEIQNFTLIEEFIMPDKSKVYLYKSKKINTFRLNYTPYISQDYKYSSARIDIHSEDMEFTLEKVKSNGVAQFANWLPKEEDWTKNWMTQMELVTNNWQQLWIEFVPDDSGYVYVQLRGSFYPDNKTNRHEVYVDDVVVEGEDTMIENGSFEEQDKSDNPIAWGLPAASTSQVVIFPRSGDYSMIVWHDSPVVQKIPVKAGVKYRISAWFKFYQPL